MGANGGGIGCNRVESGRIRPELVGQTGVEALSIWGVLLREGDWSKISQ